MRDRLKWGRISRKGSEIGRYPVQQLSYLGRNVDSFVLSPYGLHSNLPTGQLALILDEAGRIIMGTSAIGRIVVEEGEVVVYHPGTKSRIQFKNNGEIDIKALSVNVDADNVNLGIGGQPIARVGDDVSVNVIGGSSSGTHTGTITSGGGNTST